MRSCVVTCGFKNHMRNLQICKQAVENKVEKSSVYNVLAGGMYFLDKSNPSNFILLDFPLLV